MPENLMIEIARKAVQAMKERNMAAINKIWSMTVNQMTEEQFNHFIAIVKNQTVAQI